MLPGRFNCKEEQLKMYTAVLFDLDGTLLNTIDDLADSCNEALRKLHLPCRTTSEVREFVGNGIARLMELAVPDGKNSPLYGQSVTLMKECYARNCLNKTKPYDGIMELLLQLRSKNIKTGVISNKPDAQVKELVEHYFSSVISSEYAAGDSPEAKRKPAPDTVLAVMKRLGVRREDTVYAGDSEVDIETAHNAGIPCISVSWGFRSKDFLLKHNAQHIASAPRDILKYV